MYFPKYAQNALDALCSVPSCEAYFVGGCVRDLIMRRRFSDIDITTNLLPDAIAELFCGFRLLETGKKHGTITVFIEEASPVEITTYRVDGDYDDRRRPNSVTFTTSLKEDLSRRDFTINALCSKGDYTITDYFGGCDDIKNKLIRAIGNPEQRFCEDALRILRAFRFMSQLSFTIEENTQSAAKKCSGLLRNVSLERITSELSKLLLGDNCSNTLSLMWELGVLTEFINPPDRESIRATSKSPALLEIRAAIFLSRLAIDTLKFSAKQKSKIKLLVENRYKPLPYGKPEMKRMLSEFSFEHLSLLLSFKGCFGEDISANKKLLVEIFESKECYTLSGLKINGTELQAIGFEGREIGKTLDILLDMVIDEKLANELDCLLGYARGL